MELKKEIIQRLIFIGFGFVCLLYEHLAQLETDASILSLIDGGLDTLLTDGDGYRFEVLIVLSLCHFGTHPD